MKTLGRYKSKLGNIVIWESEHGDRLYCEGEIIQSQSSLSGESRLPYVKFMEAFLDDAKSVLLLGCGGGNLATMLVRRGKNVTVVDNNPVSFDLAREFFGMPENISCIAEDFREYLATETHSFDGIAIDVGGPGFCYEEQLDPATCHSITARLNPGGSAILNMIAATDFDTAPDLIGGSLSEGLMSSWILDQPGLLNRNVLLACLSKASGVANKRYMADVVINIGRHWVSRRPRRQLSHASKSVVIDATYVGGVALDAGESNFDTITHK